jgi:uncharacterized repeat protein (TIGR03803 family)
MPDEDQQLNETDVGRQIISGLYCAHVRVQQKWKAAMRTTCRPKGMRLLICSVFFCAASLSGSAHAQTPRILHLFCDAFGQVCAQGSDPAGSLIRDKAGNLYGTTFWGGTPGCNENLGCGTVFRLAPDGTLTVLYTFKGGSDGGNPWDRLTRDGDGNLYGAALCCGNGIVFKLAPDGTETVLHAFGSGDGSQPRGSLLRDKKGNLYGVTRGGEGNVYKLTPGGKVIVLYTFCQQAGCADGELPNEGLVADDAGNFYGTTNEGGNGGIVPAGTVFEVTSDRKEKVLWNFCSRQACDDGEFPLAGLIRDKSGNLYGTTQYGGGVGGVFKLAPDGTETVLHAFSGGDGINPECRLAMDKNGNLYGTTILEGANGAGTAFKVAPDGSFTKLLNFPRTMQFASGLLLGRDGMLYGTTPGYFWFSAFPIGGTVFALNAQ